MKKQTVYLPVKVEDKPKLEVTSIETFEIFDYVESKEGYFFTPEQLNQLLSDVIKDALDTAAENAYLITVDVYGSDTCDLDKQSITNTFEETFNKHKV